MPYKDPAQQRAYLRNWRLQRKQRRTRVQQALKTSPDGALQTGRSAVQAYQLARSQLSAVRATSRHIEVHRPPAVLPVNTSRHLAVPIASLLVEVLFKMFS